MTGIPPHPSTIAYGDTSPSQVLDLYVPGTAGHAWRGAHPVVLAIHGGAFAFGDRAHELDALPGLLDRGYAVASVDYRLSGEATFPAAVEDVKSAVAHLRLHADELGLDPSFMAAWGRSAGGYLAVMLGATSGMTSEFDGGLADPADSSVQAVVAWYPPIDFSVMDAQLAKHPPTGPGRPIRPHDDAGSPESRFLGAPLKEAGDLLVRSNPLHHLERNPTPPPFFLAVGTEDRMVPHQQTLLLHDALVGRGASTRLEVLEGAEHIDERFEVELTRPALDWLDGLR